MIEKRGIKLILLELTLLPLLLISKYFLLLIFSLILFTAVFFRDPYRVIGEGVVSPADGKIDYVGEKRIEIFMRPFDCHINRSPVDGIVKKIIFKRGSKPPAFIRSEKAMRNEIYIENEDGVFKVTQVAGIFARRIVCYVKEGEYVKKGQKIGMVTFGSRVILEVPDGYVFVKSIGEKVKAGETIALRK